MSKTTTYLRRVFLRRLVESRRRLETARNLGDGGENLRNDGGEGDRFAVAAGMACSAMSPCKYGRTKVAKRVAAGRMASDFLQRALATTECRATRG